MAPQLLMYIPVIHAGYDRLISKWGGHAEVLVLGESFGQAYPTLKKEIRALRPDRVVKYIRSSGLAPDVRILEVNELPDAITRDLLVIPDEEILRQLVRDHNLAERVTIRTEKTFLRWDRTRSLRRHEPRYSARVSLDETNRLFGRYAQERGARSSDWWRQVGALAVCNGQVIHAAHNEHHPTEYSPYVNGDPRNNFSRGRRIDLSTALHAEASLIGEAAKHGTPLQGADLYVSTFPCPACARLIVAAGISRCFYSSGYSMLEGEDILEAGGVDVIFADLDPEPQAQLSLADALGSSIVDRS